MSTQKCDYCDWTNVDLRNVGEQNAPKWICHGCTKRLTAENTALRAELAILNYERNEFNSYLGALPSENRPVLVGPIQVARWHIERLTAEVAELRRDIERIGILANEASPKNAIWSILRIVEEHAAMTKGAE